MVVLRSSAVHGSIGGFTSHRYRCGGEVNQRLSRRRNGVHPQVLARAHNNHDDDYNDVNRSSNNSRSRRATTSNNNQDKAALKEEEPYLLSQRTFLKTQSRIVAIGDLHGDLNKTVSALKLAGVLTIDDVGSPIWCGGDSIVVQLGDILDRGDSEIQILHLFLRLREQAQESNGDVFLLNGNHESLNICGDFRYVTQGGFLESARVAGLPPDLQGHFQAQLKARLALFAPGGPIARELANSYAALQINDTVFAHGGVMPHHVEYGLGKLNDEMSRWMNGEKGTRSPLLAMGSPDSILWNREYSREVWNAESDMQRSCSILARVLNELNANQMVVGHTPQERGCNCACKGKIWRIDVGMSSGVMNTPAQVIEIMPSTKGDGQSEILVLTDSGVVSANNK